MTSCCRYAALPMISLLAERLAKTVAPITAASELGGTGIQRSSQISTASVNPGRLRQSKSKLVEWDALSIQIDFGEYRAIGRAEIPRIVKLLVIRQVGFGHDA